MHKIKLSGYTIGTEFDSSILLLEQNNYATKTVTVYIIVHLDTWPQISLNDFKLKYCFFSEINIVENSDKGKWIYSVYGIAFDGVDLWNFDGGGARNAVIPGVDSSSSSYNQLIFSRITF